MPTFTCYPVAGTSADGYVYRQVNPGETWTAIRGGSGTTKNDTGTISQAGFWSNVDALWAGIARAVFIFDTSAIPAGATILSATVSLYGQAKINSNEYTTKFDIYTCNPSSNSSLHTADYSTFGTTSQTTGAINLSSLSTTGYNDWQLSATGISNIVRGGLTKFGMRERTYDGAGANPNWTSAADFEFLFYTIEASASRWPKLVVVTSDTAYNDAPSGAIVLGGSCVSNKSVSSTVAPTGGIALGGSSSHTLARSLSGSGGIVLGGSATSVVNIRLTVRLMSAGVEIASWTHVLTGTQARVSWTQFQLPFGGGVAPAGGISLDGSCVSVLTPAHTIPGVRAQVSVRGKPGYTIPHVIQGARALVSVAAKLGGVVKGHLVVGARAEVSVAGVPGGFRHDGTVTGTRALVSVICSPAWGCGVRILFVEDSEEVFLETEDTITFGGNPTSSPDRELALVGSGGGSLDPVSSEEFSIDPDRSSCS